MNHEFMTMEACQSAEDLLIRAYADEDDKNTIWISCIIDDSTSPTYTDTEADKKTSINPMTARLHEIEAKKLKDIETVGEPKIHQSNDDLPIHKD